PCVLVLPSIVASKVPLASNFRTTLGPASPTYTSPADGPPELSTPTLVGLESWPAPKAALKVPVAPNFCTRLLPLSAPYTSPVLGLPATPTGAWNWPAPEPVLPKLLSGRNSACAVVAPSASVKAQAAPATLTTRAGPKRPRYQLLATRLPVSALSV